MVSASQIIIITIRLIDITDQLINIAVRLKSTVLKQIGQKYH